jgi:putative transcriptional regulator
MIAHHPGQDMLLAYAAGHVPEAVSLVVATHLALCPRCRDVASLGDAIGGAVLETLPPAPVSVGVFGKLDLQSKYPEPMLVAESREHETDKRTPEPLRSYLQGTLDTVRWIPMAPGLSYRPLIADRCSARLLRSRPGRGIGMHTHTGGEFSLVLAGGYTDSSGHYLRGDFQTADRHMVHRPIADDGKDCIILGVTNAPLIFLNPIVGLVAKLVGC